jgi:hypothetical protein
MYESASGQKLNADKTSIFFSRNTGADFRALITSATGISSSTCYEKYLGLPAFVGRSKMRTFEGIQSRVRKKVDGWKEKFLSQAGKEILIKTVIQEIPTYCMSVFQLPKKLCSILNSIMSRFWWGRSACGKGMAWMSWGRMGASKRKGGMGFRDLEIFNRALLAKKSWRLLKFPESLVARVMKGKYYPEGDFLVAQLGCRPSFAWRSIFQARGVVEEGMLWRVGNGETVQIWKDKWLPPPLSTLFYSSHHGLEANSKVSALIDRSSRWWNVQLLQDNFSVDEIARICSIFPNLSQAPNTMYWKGTSHGHFSVRSAYFLEQNRQNESLGESSGAREEEEFWQELWKIETPAVVKNFLWKVGNNMIFSQQK